MHDKTVAAIKKSGPGIADACAPARRVGQQAIRTSVQGGSRERLVCWRVSGRAGALRDALAALWPRPGRFGRFWVFDRLRTLNLLPSSLQVLKSSSL